MISIRKRQTFHPIEGREALRKHGIRHHWPPNRDGYVKCQCPFHGDTGMSMSFNTRTGFWKCFSAHCGLSGFIRDFGDKLKQAEKLLLTTPVTIEERLFDMAYSNAQISAHQSWTTANEWVRKSKIPPHIQDWLYDRLDQFYAALPPPDPTVQISDLDAYKREFQHEVDDIRRTASAPKNRIDSSQSRSYYPRRWRNEPPFHSDTSDQRGPSRTQGESR